MTEPEFTEPYITYKQFDPDNVTLKFSSKAASRGAASVGGVSFVNISYKYKNGLTGPLNIKLPEGYNSFTCTDDMGFGKYQSTFKFTPPLVCEEEDATKSNITRTRNKFTAPTDTPPEKQEEYEELVTFLDNMDKLGDKVQDVVVKNNKAEREVTQNPPFGYYGNHAQVNLVVATVQNFDPNNPVKPPVTFIEPDEEEGGLRAKKATMEDIATDSFVKHPCTAFASLQYVTCAKEKVNFKFTLKEMVVKTYKDKFDGKSGTTTMNPYSMCEVFEEDLSEEEKKAIMNMITTKEPNEEGDKEPKDDNVNGSSVAKGFVPASQINGSSSSSKRQRTSKKGT